MFPLFLPISGLFAIMCLPFALIISVGCTIIEVPVDYSGFF